MSKISELLKSYASFISIPWRTDTAAAQRVMFCIYDENEERGLLAMLDEFELATRGAGHAWLNYDLDKSFAVWLTGQKYAEKYFRTPQRLFGIMHRFKNNIEDGFSGFLARKNADAKTVVAITGIGSLFGLLKVKDVIDQMAPHVRGRLVVFFPGSYEHNNYRLLDAYDGWNYLAVPLMAGLE